MANISALVFRHLTPADFFNINKPPGTEQRGGGQSYIDFSIGDVSLDDWHAFFDNIHPCQPSSGPAWKIPLNSLGHQRKQDIRIAQRRNTSVSIRSQKLHSSRGNRVRAWHPDFTDFPQAPGDISTAEDSRIINLVDGLRIFILKTTDHEYWAGWMLQPDIEALAKRDPRFKPMLFNRSGYLTFLDPALEADLHKQADPFGLHEPIPSTPPATHDGGQHVTASPSGYNHKTNRPDFETMSGLLNEDFTSVPAQRSPALRNIVQRNQRAVKHLKALYGTCQITGDTFVFAKHNGESYLEAHHLVPLGKGGADHPANIVIISAHIHRMLHFARVEGVDLNQMQDDSLTFSINGTPYTIKWLPEHVSTVMHSP